MYTVNPETQIIKIFGHRVKKFAHMYKQKRFRKFNLVLKLGEIYFYKLLMKYKNEQRGLTSFFLG